MARRIKNETPVRVHDPSGVNRQYKNALGIVKDGMIVLGGVWSYKVKLNSNAEVWFTESELRVLENT